MCCCCHFGFVSEALQAKEVFFCSRQCSKHWGFDAQLFEHFLSQTDSTFYMLNKRLFSKIWYGQSFDMHLFVHFLSKTDNTMYIVQKTLPFNNIKWTLNCLLYFSYMIVWLLCIERFECQSNLKTNLTHKFFNRKKNGCSIFKTIKSIMELVLWALMRSRLLLLTFFVAVVVLLHFFLLLHTLVYS